VDGWTALLLLDVHRRQCVREQLSASQSRLSRFLSWIESLCESAAFNHRAAECGRAFISAQPQLSLSSCLGLRVSPTFCSLSAGNVPGRGAGIKTAPNLDHEHSVNIIWLSPATEVVRPWPPASHRLPRAAFSAALAIVQPHLFTSGCGASLVAQVVFY
jgi:hypothetical protein